MGVKIRSLAFVMSMMGLTGCSSLLLPSTPAPVYYRLSYKPATVRCSTGFHKGIRIWPFAASSPYNQPDMVVIKQGKQVSYSKRYQWVASPGTLIPDSLLMDLSSSSIFTQAVSSNSPITTSLELTGHIFTFAWEKKNSAYHAVLKVEVSLVDTTGGRAVVLRKDYRFRSGPFEKNDPENFATAMGRVVSEFSQSLQEDFCRKAESS